jgi:hypothetical protein
MSRQARKDEKAERKRAKREADERAQETGTTEAPADSGSPPSEASA